MGPSGPHHRPPHLRPVHPLHNRQPHHHHLFLGDFPQQILSSTFNDQFTAFDWIISHQAWQWFKSLHFFDCVDLCSCVLFPVFDAF